MCWRLKSCAHIWTIHGGNYCGAAFLYRFGLYYLQFSHRPASSQSLNTSNSAPWMVWNPLLLPFIMSVRRPLYGVTTPYRQVVLHPMLQRYNESLTVSSSSSLSERNLHGNCNQAETFSYIIGVMNFITSPNDIFCLRKHKNIHFEQRTFNQLYTITFEQCLILFRNLS